ncbi:MAG: hypothetical protein SWK76_13875 [Actinomycetota bacterium]|nr:hypothetical protein [Actinomycetota bacterium]
MLDTEAFVDIVGPLIDEGKVVRAISEELNIEVKLESVLPDQISFIASPITDVLQDFAVKTANKMITSMQFQWLWEKAVRLARSTAIEVIRGGGAVKL